jgi:hypothetical protein
MRIENRPIPRLPVELGLKPLVVLDRAQEFIRDRDRDVEIGQALLIVFRMNKAQDVGMRDRENAHVCASPDAALFDCFGHRIDNLHERDRTGSNSTAFSHWSACWAK